MLISRTVPNSLLCIDVSKNSGQVNTVAATRTIAMLLIAGPQGFTVIFEFRYSIGCRIARYLCLAISKVINVDEYSIRGGNGYNT